MLVPQSIDELRSYALKEDEASMIAVERPDYEPKEVAYLDAIRKRLQSAKTQRDGNMEQFDGMTYVERCQQNRRLAQTAVKPRTNRAEIEFSTGMPRKKLLDQLAQLNGLNLSADVTAFDENNFALAELGEAVENIYEKQVELTNDEERAMLRRYVLFEQGEVFVERIWQNDYKPEKKLQQEFKGKFRGVNWSERLKKVLGGLKTNVVRNEYVYLGDITKFFMEDEPFIFSRRLMSHSQLEPLFKDFEMWKYIGFTLKYFDSAFSYTGINSFNPFWALETVQKGFHECIAYQDKDNNEFQYFIDGIPMFPIGFPMPWKHGNYSIVKQLNEIIDPDFAYGRSLIQRVKMSGAMEDEMWRNVLTMFQQMLKPPMINNTGLVLSSRIFLPGVMTNNIPDGKLKPLLEGLRQGMRGELQVLDLVRSNLNENSAEPQFGGQAAKGAQTATESSFLQAQAEKIFGQAILVSALLEKKLAYLGVDLILENYFDPVDTKLNEISQTLENVYRTSNVMKPVHGKGMGQEVVMTMDKGKMPSAYGVFQAEKQQEKVSGMPTKIIVLDREEILKTRYAFRISVVPMPRRSSNLQKLMFREKTEIYKNSPNFSMDWFEEHAAITFGDNPSKVFNKQQVPTAAPGIMPPQDPRMAAAKQMPQERKPALNTAGMGM